VWWESARAGKVPAQWADRMEGWVVGGMVWGVAGVGPRRQGAGAMGRPHGGVGGRGRPQAVVGSVLQVLQRHQAQDAPQVMRTWGAHLEQQL